LPFLYRSKNSSRPSRTTLLRLFMLLALLMPAVAGYAEENDPAADGSALYAKNCTGCHRSLDRTFLNDRSVKRIRSAINHIPAMRDLRMLSDSELAAISLVLASPAGTAPENSR